ncbi:transposase, partial [Chryseobacterium sp. Leaf201]|uniref:transposase n=1 Tax=Chryseobacterium sp. Leaf201 TaxID=1735672 RepID=UPI000A8E4952
IMGEIIEILSEAEISHKGLFLNADSGFDSKNLKQKLEMEEITGNIKINPRNRKAVDNDYYFDEKLYESRFKIEQANAWLDGFKALLIRFETLDITWKAMHFLAFSLTLIKKLKV